jgi:hypothetical protein
MPGEVPSRAGPLGEAASPASTDGRPPEAAQADEAAGAEPSVRPDAVGLPTPPASRVVRPDAAAPREPRAMGPTRVVPWAAEREARPWEPGPLRQGPAAEPAVPREPPESQILLPAKASQRPPRGRSPRHPQNRRRSTARVRRR